MQPAHLLLFLKQAMTVAYKANLKIIASSFARRMLELNPKPDWSTQARKVMQLCDQSPTNAFEVNYDERNPFVVCGESMVPIYRGSAVLQCSYCKAAPARAQGQALQRVQARLGRRRRRRLWRLLAVVREWRDARPVRRPLSAAAAAAPAGVGGGRWVRTGGDGRSGRAGVSTTKTKT